MDNTKTTGSVRLKCYRTDGTLKWDTGHIYNLTTNVGKANLSSLFGNAAALPFLYLAIGTSNTAVSAAQTTLGAEITTGGLGRALATASQTTTSTTNDTAKLTLSLTSSGSFTIEEIGYFTAVSAGIMGGRALTGSKTIISGETLVEEYYVQFT